MYKEEKVTKILDFSLFSKRIQPDLKFVRYYLSTVFSELEVEKRINEILFCQFLNKSQFLSQILFSIFDSKKEGLISYSDLELGVLILFEGKIQDLVHLVFKFLDFDGDEVINKDDSKLVLIHFLKEFQREKEDSEHFNKAEELVNTVFKERATLTFKEFVFITEKTNSDLFLAVYLFILKLLPFSNLSSSLCRSKSDNFKDPTQSYHNRNLHFPPVKPNLISITHIQAPSNNFNYFFTGTTRKFITQFVMEFTNSNSEIYACSENVISEVRNNKKQKSEENQKIEKLLIKSLERRVITSNSDSDSNYNQEELLVDLDEGKANIMIPDNKQCKNLLKISESEKLVLDLQSQLNSNSTLTKSNTNSNIKLSINYSNNDHNDNSNIYSSPSSKKEFSEVEEISPYHRSVNEMNHLKLENYLSNQRSMMKSFNDTELFYPNSSTNFVKFKDEFPEVSEDLFTYILDNPPKITHEDYLYKYDKDTNKLRKIYLVLVERELYYFKSSCKTKLKGMHYLKYTQTLNNEEDYYYDKRLNYNYKTINKTRYIMFTLYLKGRIREFYVKTEEEYKQWMKAITQVLNVKNLKSLYKMSGVLSDGKVIKVFKGRSLKTNDPVAIKVFPKSKILEEREMYQNMLTEVNLLSIVNHPNVAKLVDFFEDFHNFYIITDYLEKGDLLYNLKHDILDYEKKRKLIYQICTGVEYLHTIGIVHRDIKPSNIAISNYNTIKIIDLGLSKILGSNQSATEYCGTEIFAAPELLLGLPYNKSIDIWSLGTTIYTIIKEKYLFNNRVDVNTILLSRGEDFDSCLKFLLSAQKREIAELIEYSLIFRDDKRYTIKEILNLKFFSKFKI